MVQPVSYNNKQRIFLWVQSKQEGVGVQGNLCFENLL